MRSQEAQSESTPKLYDQILEEIYLMMKEP